MRRHSKQKNIISNVKQNKLRPNPKQDHRRSSVTHKSNGRSVKQRIELGCVVSVYSFSMLDFDLAFMKLVLGLVSFLYFYLFGSRSWDFSFWSGTGGDVFL